jgi:hypothetical protein
MPYRTGTWGDQAKHRSEGRKSYFAEYQRQWRLRNAEHWEERHAARRILGRAVANGSIKRKPCENCRSQPAQGHHTDYSKPLEVVWLCKRHHLRLHRSLSS